MAKKTEARENAVLTAARLLEQQGYHGTGLAQIIEESGCPKGSFYYHFPGGKEQLALEALKKADESMEDTFDEAEVDSASPTAYVEALSSKLAQRLEGSNYCAGCLLAGLAFETSRTSISMANACKRSFGNWNLRIAGALRKQGLAPDIAAWTAAALVSALNGALIVCRAEGSPVPLREVGAAFGRWLKSA